MSFIKKSKKSKRVKLTILLYEATSLTAVSLFPDLSGIAFQITILEGSPETLGTRFSFVMSFALYKISLSQIFATFD